MGLQVSISQILVAALAIIPLVSCSNGGDDPSPPIQPGTPPMIRLIGAPAPSVTIGQEWRVNGEVTGDTPITLGLSSGTPSWISFDDNTPPDWGITAKPPTGTAGSYNFAVEASNGVSPDASQSFTLEVKIPLSAPTLSGAAPKSVLAGQTWSFQPTASGNPTPDLSLVGAPAWITSIGTKPNIRFEGTPSATQVGSYNFKIVASNGVNPNAELPVNLEVIAAGDAYEPDDNLSSANELKPGSSNVQTHSLHVNHDIDFVTFNLQERSAVIITTDGSSGDTLIELSKSNGPNLPRSLIATDDNSGFQEFSKIDRSGSEALAPGTYYVQVKEDGQNSTIQRYDIRLDTTPEPWFLLPSNNAPAPRWQHTAVIANDKMIIWGGASGTSGTSHTPLNSGAYLDLATMQWFATSRTSAPDPRRGHTAISTGNRMIVWGGEHKSLGLLNTGGIYNPATNTWTSITQTGAPDGRIGHTAIWTGTEMIVFGGRTASSFYSSSGGRYNVAQAKWYPLATSGRGPDRSYHSAVWNSYSGTMLIWGGLDSGRALDDGRSYNPANNTWSTLSTNGAPLARAYHAAIWTGSSIGRMLIWGGSERNGNVLASGGEYSVGQNRWFATTQNSAPSARDEPRAVWDSTNDRMLVWGGWNGGSGTDDGAVYDYWSSAWTSMPSSPLGKRYSHTAVWDTHRQRMIIWGGFRPGFIGWGDGAVFQ